MKRIIRNAIVAFAAVAMVAGLTGCPNSTANNFEEPEDIDVVETLILENSEFNWSEFYISEYTKYAKPGAKIHLDVANRDPGDGPYCKVLILAKDWTPSGVTEAYYEGDTKNVLTYDKDDSGAAVRAQVEGAGQYYFVLNEDACGKNLFLTGNAIVKKIIIEYVGGKKEIKPIDPTASEEVTLPSSITCVKNEYAATPQVQAKVSTGFSSLKAGDKVTLKMKGQSSKAFKSEIFIVDCTEDASWWTQLADPYAYDFAEDFETEYTFEITADPVGTTEDAITFAINGVDGDETVTLTFSEITLKKE